MRRFVPAALLFLIASVPTSAQGPKKAPPAIRISCDRDAALYKLGETAKFFIQTAADGEAAYRLSEDGFKTVKQGKISLTKGKTYSLEGTLEAPGFLLLQVDHTGDGKKQTAYAAAGFDPTKIAPTAKMPDDFDAFWEAGKNELAKVPMNPKLERSEKHGNTQVDCYKITLDNVEGKKVQGWLSVPKGTGPFPAILTVPGAGVYPIEPDPNPDPGKKFAKLSELGALSMNIIIHDIPVDESPAFYKKLLAGSLKDYRDQGLDDKTKSYYRAVILGCLRCNDYLTSRPDYNGTDLAVTGGSQGGALTLITSGLDPRVKLAAPNVAAMCEHGGVAHGRVSGWPHWLMRKGIRDDKERFAKVLEASAYYDAVNFARKFKGKSLHGVGFIDTVCAPTTVYAAYNVHPDPKQMVNSPLMGHGTDPRWLAAREKFFKDNMKLMPPAK
jgi:cephalosporin-C deacetylase-like acetyl esterase